MNDVLDVILKALLITLLIGVIGALLLFVAAVVGEVLRRNRERDWPDTE